LQILSLGEVLWDKFGDQEFLGGAPLNFSANSRRLGHDVALLTAVGSDERGERALRAMEEMGLNTSFVQTSVERPTGLAIVSTDSAGNGTFMIPRPAAFDTLKVDGAQLSLIQNLQPDWIYYGTLAQTDANSEEILIRIGNETGSARRFYDMNLRTGHWNLPLVERLSDMADVIKLNEAEAELLFRFEFGNEIFTVQAFCENWSRKYGVEVICVTLGDQGCSVYSNGTFESFPGFRVSVVDTVGAGDAFAAAFLHGLQRDWPIGQIARFANGLGALIASRAGATPIWTIEECLDLIAPDESTRLVY
jgi:fructokinase